MEKIKAPDNNDFIKQTESSFKQENNIGTEFNTNAANYFDYIYSYPPKIQIKWDSIDELNEDLFIGSNYGVLEHSVPFIDVLDDWFFSGTLENAVSEDHPYKISTYADGFVEKINSTNFFLKKTRKIQKVLDNIPIFVVLNGQGQIVLSKPSNNLGPNSFINYVNEKLYDSCGAFDASVDKKSDLGLFFMTHNDAEKYLKECAKSDFEGTQTVGLSIHSINLSSAYRITREHHPGIDFRFVPNLTEVKDLLVTSIGKSDMIVEDEQQQLRFRPRSTNLFPYLNKLGKYLSPTSSFLQGNEYFKGVPIYIVQVHGKPRNFFAEQAFKFFGSLDSIYNGSIKSLDSVIGFGHNHWIMQGSIQDAGSSEKLENFIFFEKDQALQFIKENGRKVARFSGGRTSNLEFIVRKPKIFVYNLEDFLEDWEDKILGELNVNENTIKGLFKSNAFNFISPSYSSNEVRNLKNEYTQTPLKNFTQSVDVKFRVLKRSIGIFFSLQ